MLTVGLLTGGYGEDELARAGAFRVYRDPAGAGRLARRARSGGRSRLTEVSRSNPGDRPRAWRSGSSRRPHRREPGRRRPWPRARRSPSPSGRPTLSSLAMMRSPPASRKSIARAAAGMALTAVAPRLSEATTPWNFSLSAGALDDRRREYREVVGVDALVGRERDHHDGHATSIARCEGLEVGSSTVVTVSVTVGREVGVAHDPAKPGEVLGGGRHAARLHAVDEGCDVAGHGRRRVAELTLELADRGVRRVGPGRTTSATGASSRLTPAALSWAPHRAAAFERRRRPSPGSTADGIVSKPGPDSAWTSPPSWLAATKKRTPPSPRASPGPARLPVTARTAARPGLRANDTEPKWYVAIAEAPRSEPVLGQPDHEQLADPLRLRQLAQGVGDARRRLGPARRGRRDVRCRRLRSGGRRRRLHRRGGGRRGRDHRLRR